MRINFVRLIGIAGLSSILVCTAASAQLNIQTDDGKSVSIGPGGISIRKPGKQVDISPGSINAANSRNRATITTNGKSASIKATKGQPSTKVRVEASSDGVNRGSIGTQRSALGAGAAATVGGAAMPDIMLLDNKIVANYKMVGNGCAVNGNKCQLTLDGTCGELIISGNKNIVKVETASTIRVLGNENQVFWKRGAGGRDPVIMNVGNDNLISRQ